MKLNRLYALICSLLVATAAMAVNASSLIATEYAYANFMNIGASPTLCIYQDKLGMIWFGTRNGLISYNGYNLHSYISQYGSNSNVINCILAINDNTLLLGTDKGLLSFNLSTRAFSEINSHVQDIRTMALDGKTVWIGTYKNGLYSYDISTKKIKAHTIGKRTIPLIKALEVIGGSLFVGTYDGLYVYDKAKRWQKARSEKTFPLCSSFYDKQNKVLWLGTEGMGLCQYDFKSKSIKETNVIGKDVVKCIVKDGRGDLVMCTDAGLYIYDGKTHSVKHVMHDSHRQSSLCNDIVWCAFLDSDSNVWFGTNRGTSLWISANEMHIKPLSEITSANYGNLFTSIVKDDDGTYWMGGENGILRFDKHNEATWFRNSSSDKFLRHNHVSKIYKDREGKIWIASDGGVANYNKAKDAFDYFSIRHRSQGYDTRWSYDLYEDGKERLWIASYLGGLFVVDKRKLNGSNTQVEADTVLMGCPIFQLGYLGNQKLAANTSRGIVCIDMRTMKVKEYDAYDDLMTVFKGAIWYSAEGKLYRIGNNGKTTEIVYDRGSASRILSFISDEKRLWFSSSEGIFYYDNAENAVYKYSAKPSDLLTGYYDSERHSIIWGGNDCIVYQSLANANKQNKKKDRHIFITSIFANGVELAEDKDIKFHPTNDGATIRLLSRASITLELSNFIYTQNGAKEFYYKIDDDGIWTKLPNGQNQLTLAGLSGGKHLLKISNSNPQIDKRAGISRYTIFVPYPWYASTAAWIVYVLAIIFLIYIIIRYIAKRNRRIYERKERERFLELSSLKMDFFVNISHELKTPLSLIIAPLDKIISEVKDAKVKTSLGKVHDNALRLSTLISKVMDFKKMEYESEDTLMASSVDICQVVKNCIGNFSAICEQRNITMKFTSNTSQLMTKVDILKIESIVNNLLSNAVKYVADEIGVIEVSLTKEGNSFTLVIEDNGRGVKEKDLPFVFIRYFQSHESGVNGSGIGLHLVKKFVELHGGSVSAHNDNGFVVSIKLPISQEEKNDNDQSVPLDNSIGELNTNKKTILVIDDNKEIVDFLTEALADKYECLKAFDGEEGLKVVEHQCPDLVIVDQMMPKVDGISFVRQIRHNAPTASIPIIMLTAKDDYQMEMESIKTGVDVFMSKPFDIKKLLLHVVRLLKKHETIEKCQRVKEIANHDFTNCETSNNTDEALLERITSSIEKNMAKEGFNVEALAEDIGISQKQLYRKVKQLTGMTPVNYLRKMRLKKAYALLSQPGFTITEVLYMIGISNAAYFSKCFLEEFGISPKDLSNKTKLGDNEAE